MSKQPAYYKNNIKAEARDQVILAYRKITGLQSIPEGYGYWTLCNKQPDTEGSEITQLVNCNFLQKNQFYGIDNDADNEGIIEFNKQQHPEANWFKGDWLDAIEDNYEVFKPALVYFDYTRTVLSSGCHVYLAKTLNLCPPGTLVAANLMLSNGHSKKIFDHNTLCENIIPHLRHPKEWNVLDKCYFYKASKTHMSTYIFGRNKS